MGKIDLLINASILNEQNTGLGVYTYQVLENIVPKLIKKGISFRVLCRNEKFLPKCCREYARIVKCDGFVSRIINTSFEYRSIYRLAWSTTQHGGLFSRTKQIITIHDLTPLKYPNGRKYQLYYYRFLLPVFIRKSKYIFTVSENTKNDIINYYKINPDKIIVLYEAIDFANKIESDDKIFCRLSEQYHIEKYKYFIIIGIHFEYKNIHGVIEAFSRSTKLRAYKIIIIGKGRDSYINFLKNLIRKKDLEERIQLLGFVSSDIKNTLIINSVAVVFPSLYEGFGIPILEAFKNEVPMICSNTSSLPEVGGDAVLYFDPLQPDNIKEKMEQIIETPDLRESLIRKGSTQKNKFNWDSITNNMLYYIVETLDGGD